MSFNLYFAGTQNDIAEQLMLDNNCCRLYSQLNDRKRGETWINYCREIEPRTIFVDSGAYSAWSIGTVIDTDEYIEYLNKNSDAFTAFASVDNIPGELTRKPTLQERKESPILTWENYLYMRERINEKDKLIPTFHAGEDLKHLSNLLEVKLDNKHIPYIALGGTVGTPVNYKKKWYSTCFKVINESSNPNVKVHAFGMTSLDVLESYPFYSADSTSWIMTAANGSIMTSYGTIVVSKQGVDKPNYIGKLPIPIQHNIQSEVQQWGTTVEECAEDYKMRTVVNISYLQNWANNYIFKGNNRYQKTLF